MKRFVFIVSLLLVCFPVFSLEIDEKPNDAIKKFSRGIANVISSPLEIPESVADVAHEEGLIASMTYGVVNGLVGTIERMGVGFYEMLTFPAPGPKKDYKPILTDPEFYGTNSKVFKKK